MMILSKKPSNIDRPDYYFPASFSTVKKSAKNINEAKQSLILLRDHVQKHV